MLTVTCHVCGSKLAVPLDNTFRWLRHHDGGSHTLHSADLEMIL